MKTLHLNPRPVDRVAARVVFGDVDTEHFKPTLDPGGLAAGGRPRTFRNPPQLVGVMPEYEQDWSGHRYGRMTAMYWWRFGKSGAIWIARCDCGNYELRRPEMWEHDVPSRWRNNDGCNVCRATDLICGRVKMAVPDPNKRNKWIAGLLALGLTVDEVARCMVEGVTTQGLDASEIRALLAARQEATHPTGEPIEPIKVLKDWARRILFGGAP